jgi:hypothetical protein
VVAVVRIDAELVDNLKAVFAPILDVDQGVVERGAIIAFKAVAPTQGVRGGEYVGRGNLLQKSLEF